MSRTERRSWEFREDEDGNIIPFEKMHLSPNGRDRKGRCKCCGSARGSFRFFENRKRRRDGKKFLRDVVRDETQPE